MKRREVYHHAYGFTLIEILVVLFIISIVTSVALISYRSHEDNQLQSFANELAQLITTAQDYAMLETKVVGLVIDDDAFYFTQLNQKNKSQAKIWEPLVDAVLTRHAIPESLEVRVSIDEVRNNTEDSNEEEKTDVVEPSIVIAMNREMSPFTIYIGKKTAEPRYSIHGDADGQIETKVMDKS